MESSMEDPGPFGWRANTAFTIAAILIVLGVLGYFDYLPFF
jgi:hypothetical protein